MANIKEIMEEFRKSGEFKPELINVGNTLRPEESSRFIDLIVAASDFLKRITVENFSRELSGRHRPDPDGLAAEPARYRPTGQDLLTVDLAHNYFPGNLTHQI